MVENGKTLRNGKNGKNGKRAGLVNQGDGILERLRIRESALGAPVAFETKIRRVRRLLNMVLLLALLLLIGVLMTPLEEVYTAEGVIRPKDSAHLYAKADVEQREQTVLISEGEWVEKGQVLMRFHLPERQMEILEAAELLKAYQSDLAVQQAKSAVTEKLPLPTELWEINEQLAQSKFSRDYCKSQLERAEELAESGDVSDQEVERARLLYEQAQIEYGRLKQRLDIVDAGYTETLMAQERAEEARIRQQIESVQTRLDYLQAEFDRLSVLKAPDDGIVLEMPQKNRIGIISKGHELVYMGLGQERAVQIFGLQQNFDKVEVGQAVRYRSKVYDAMKVAYAEGEIQEIGLIRQPASRGDAGDTNTEERYYSILGDIKKEPKPLQLDSNVTAKIVLRKRPIVLLLFGVN